MTAPTPTPTVPRYVLITKWLWLVGITISVIGTIVAVALAPAAPIVWVMLVISVVQAAVAIPAALVLTRQKRWARVALMIMAALSIGSLYQAFKMQNWPALVLNLALGCTLGLLQDPSVREFFHLPARRGRSITR